MNELSLETRQMQKPAGERLDSWKAIATYLKRDVKTVQRWEKREGMPVHRHLHDKRGSVYAISSELDAWQQSRRTLLEPDEDQIPSEPETVSDKKALPANAHLPVRPIARRVLRWSVLAAALLVVATMIVWLSRGHIRNLGEAGQGRLMLAVLPFENLTGDAGQDYLTDGVTEEMISQLSNLDPQRLGVIARSSVMYYKNQRKPLQQIGHDLGVQYVLEGSVRRDKESARVSVALVRVADGETVWTDTFDRPIGDVLSMQSEVAQHIGNKLQIQFLGHPGHKPTSTEVVEAYLRGRFELNRADPSDAAPAYFQRAIALDPSYASAYAGLADFYCFRAVREDEDSEKAWPLAEQYATKAMALDADNEDAHIAIAWIRLMHDWDWPAARQHALRALQLNPNSPEAHVVYARYLRTAGNMPKALMQIEHALALDPYRESLKDHLGMERYLMRDYPTLVASARSALARDPNNLNEHANLCIWLGRLRSFDEAAAECSKALVLEGHPSWASAFTEEYRQHGYEVARLSMAKKQLNEYLKRPHPDLWNLANAYADAGMKDETFHALFEGLSVHEPGLLQIRVDPDFDLIRNDPRYAELVQRIGFPNE